MRKFSFAMERIRAALMGVGFGQSRFEAWGGGAARVSERGVHIQDFTANVAESEKFRACAAVDRCSAGDLADGFPIALERRRDPG